MRRHPLRRRRLRRRHTRTAEPCCPSLRPIWSCRLRQTKCASLSRRRGLPLGCPEPGQRITSRMHSWTWRPRIVRWQELEDSSPAPRASRTRTWRRAHAIAPRARARRARHAGATSLLPRFLPRVAWSRRRFALSRYSTHVLYEAKIFLTRS